MKKGNKQCLFDTPRRVMVNKEMMSEYLDHKKQLMFGSRTPSMYHHRNTLINLKTEILKPLKGGRCLLD